MADSKWQKNEARETAVDPHKCIWCKISKENADESVSYVPVGNDSEQICTECLRDLRGYKRYSLIQARMSTAYAPEARKLINEKLEEAATVIQQLDLDDEQLTIDPLSVHNANKIHESKRD